MDVQRHFEIRAIVSHIVIDNCEQKRYLKQESAFVMHRKGLKNY